MTFHGPSRFVIVPLFLLCLLHTLSLFFMEAVWDDFYPDWPLLSAARRAFMRASCDLYLRAEAKWTGSCGKWWKSICHMPPSHQQCCRCGNIDALCRLNNPDVGEKHASRCVWTLFKKFTYRVLVLSFHSPPLWSSLLFPLCSVLCRNAVFT